MIPKNIPIRDRKYLDYLRTQPCIVTGHRTTDYEGVDPAHIGTAGKSLKSGDDEALPLSHTIHDECHRRGEMTVLREKLPNNVLRAALRALAREGYREWRNENG